MRIATHGIVRSKKWAHFSLLYYKELLDFLNFASIHVMFFLETRQLKHMAS